MRLSPLHAPRSGPSIFYVLGDSSTSPTTLNCSLYNCPVAMRLSRGWHLFDYSEFQSKMLAGRGGGGGGGEGVVADFRAE